MAETERKLTERRLVKYPGWTELQWLDATDGHKLNTEFRGPGGELVSNYEFRKRVKAGEIPTIDADGAVKPAPAARAAAVSDPPTLGDASAAGEAPEPFDLPSPEPASRRAAPGQASAAELSLTATIALTILTSLLSLITRTPELTMSEMEAQAISVPLANIAAKSSLNRRFGRYLADSSDYTLLGYALYAYGYRVIGQVSARAQADAAALGTQRGYPHAVPQAAQAPQPARAAQPSPAATAQSGQPGERTAPASGGIGGAVNGTFAAESSRIVGYNPIPHTGAS